MNRIILGLLAAAVLAAGGLGWQVHRQAGAIARAEERLQAAQATIEAARKELDLARALSAKRAAQAAAAKRESEAKRRELAAILRREREWADQPIPPDVLEALR